MLDPNAHSQIRKGMFIIASPEIDSGIFFRGVILICENNTEGSFGLLMNQPLDMKLPEELLDIDQIENPYISIRAGGPVQPNQMMLLHNSKLIEHQTLNICEDVYLGGDLPFLQEASRDSQGPKIHLCFGYTGWGAGLLEREFLDGQWFIHPATAEHIFEVPPDKLWTTLLRAMGGKYASFSTIPEDLSLN